ncbi:MAG: tRNA preQ1(34) S-adenosylmethionine ribosyltransferase-isomerase QueA [Acidimicrobiales bacterium]
MRAPLKTAWFDYELPATAIAQHPAEPRDAARLLVDRGPATPADHHIVRDLPDLLQPGDLVVVNDTKVLPARLHLVKATQGAVEVLLLEPTGHHRQWRALVRPGRRVKAGTELFVPGATDEAPVVVVDDVLDDGRRVVTVHDDDLMTRVGEMPLPPYITEPLDDPDRYQTVFAREPGSVAAPTAGLHLTDEVLRRLADRGVDIARVELRVGLGTFRPISTDEVADHTMHTEQYRVEPDTWERIRGARRVVAVGTTVVRTLESVAATGALSGDTSLFISRGYPWQVVDVLMTNFHVPRSSLLVLVDAFMGDRWRALYDTAIAEGYRMLSFGDAMLIERESIERESIEHESIERQPSERESTQEPDA